MTTSEPSKTLSVRYGAFSCRIEGFDDPLATLREVTAHLRDLAAADRRFGAAGVGPAPSDGAQEGPPDLRAFDPVGVDGPGGAAEPAAAAPDRAPDREEGEPRARAADLDPEPGPTPAPADGEGGFDGALAALLAAGGDDDDEEAAPDPFADHFDAPGDGDAGDGDAEADDDAGDDDDGAGDDGADDDGGGDGADDGGGDGGDDDGGDDAPPPSVRPRAGDASPADVERLFAATDSRLSGTETSRAHDTITHLKDAVAARRADGGEGPGMPGADAYRADLAETIRPRRAEAGPARTPRPAPEADGATPLVLAAGHGIAAVPDDAPSPGAVMPRRVRRAIEHDSAEAALLATVGQMASGEDEDAFRSFAEEHRAAGLPALLEAAAAFSVLTTRQTTFPRPRLFQLAAEVAGEFDREEGLAAFGQLLREGAIRKVGHGNFMLSDTSRFAAIAQRRVG